jgi:hypothetical protein
MIRRLFTGRETPSASEKGLVRGTRRTRRHRPAVEALEGRALLSLLGSESRVSFNPQNTSNSDADNASSPDRTSVAVWVNGFSDGDNDIWAQRFDSNGRAAGAPIQVDFSTADSYAPHVSMDGQGRFVVTWQDTNPDGTTSVLMRYFGANGAPLTAITRVTPSGSSDWSPDVAASDGSFVISWTHQASSTNWDIQAERFVISGGVPSGQGIFVVNTDTQLENDSSVAMSPDGRFDIAYDRQYSGSDWDILASQYDGAGSLLRSNLLINYDSSQELLPSVSMDRAGNAVVAYEEYIGGAGGADGIFANRLSSGGSVGGRIAVQYVGGGVSESDPSVALAQTGGRFVVAYGNYQGIQVTEMGSDDSPLATLAPVAGAGQAISIDGLGRYLVTYSRYNSASTHDDVFSRRDLLSSEDRVSLNPQVTDNSESDNASSSAGFSVAVWINTVSVSNHDIWAQRFDSNGRAAGAPIAVDSTAADSYAPHVSMDGQGRFVVTWEDLNRDDGTWSVLMRYYSATGAPLTGINRLSAQGSTDLLPDVAASNGSFAIAWTHQSSPTNDDVWAERFVVSGGVPSGQGVFSVNSDANSEVSPSVAMSPDGRFDIAYQRQYSSADWDILASQYASNGTLLHSEYINFDAYPELRPSIAMDNAGNAVVAYEESIGYDNGIYANRLSSGGWVGGRIIVRNVGGLTEMNPSIALAPTGGQFVVAYETNDGVQVTEMGSNDVPLATLGPIAGNGPAISIDGYDRYVVTETRPNSPTGHWDILSRRYFLS